MNALAKTVCLIIPSLAIAGPYLPLPDGWLSSVQLVAALLLAAHAAEAVVALKHLKRHPGPLVDSIGLTLLFGLLHWGPLAKGRVAANDPRA